MIKYILASLFVASVVMADTQTKFVGSVSTASPGRDWNNPSNMTADDATYSRLATKIKNGQDTYTINATMSGSEFTIPVDATINGITVTIEFQEIQTGPMGDSVIFIIKGGTASGTDHKDETDDWPTSSGGLITKTWGSTSDLWGLSWTASDINASNFGVSIKGVEVDGVFAQPEIDYIQISVDYQLDFGYPTAGGTNYTQQADNKQGSKFTLSVPGDVDSIFFYAGLGGGALDPKVAKAVIYQDNAGAPGAWVATTAEVTLTTTVQWWSAGFSSLVSLASGTYWLVLHHGTEIDLRGDAGAANQRSYNTDTYSDGPADPFGSATQDAVKLSIYATFIQTSVAVSNATFSFGTEPLNTWLTPESTFVINDAMVAENFVGQISQLTAGPNVWEIDVPSNGADTIRAQWSITSATGPWSDISAYDTDFTIVTNVAVSDSVSFWLRILTPTATASYNEYSSALTVIAVSF